MSCGFGPSGSWGFASVRDWFESVILSFPTSWQLAPLAGKYYGTTIIDADGTPILSFWETEGSTPSQRQKDSFGDKWSEEFWAEYLCDSHWESEKSLLFAEYVIDAVNNEYVQENDDLIVLILMKASWEDDVFEDVACGGRNKRNPLPDTEVRKQIGGWPERKAHKEKD